MDGTSSGIIHRDDMMPRVELAEKDESGIDASVTLGRRRGPHVWNV